MGHLVNVKSQTKLRFEEKLRMKQKAAIHAATEANALLISVCSLNELNESDATCDIDDNAFNTNMLPAMSRKFDDIYANNDTNIPHSCLMIDSQKISKQRLINQHINSQIASRWSKDRNRAYKGINKLVTIDKNNSNNDLDECIIGNCDYLLSLIKSNEKIFACVFVPVEFCLNNKQYTSIHKNTLFDCDFDIKGRLCQMIAVNSNSGRSKTSNKSINNNNNNSNSNSNNDKCTSSTKTYLEELYIVDNDVTNETIFSFPSKLCTVLKTQIHNKKNITMNVHKMFDILKQNLKDMNNITIPATNDSAIVRQLLDAMSFNYNPNKQANVSVFVDKEELRKSQTKNEKTTTNATKTQPNTSAGLSKLANKYKKQEKLTSKSKTNLVPYLFDSDLKYVRGDWTYNYVAAQWIVLKDQVYEIREDMPKQEWKIVTMNEMDKTAIDSDNKQTKLILTRINSTESINNNTNNNNNSNSNNNNVETKKILWTDKSIDESLVCTFCGRYNTCKFEYDERGRPKSDCFAFYRYNTSSAKSSSKSNPCRNTPNKCVYCSKLIPFFLMKMHIIKAHPSQDENEFKHLLPTQTELKALKELKEMKQYVRTKENWLKSRKYQNSLKSGRKYVFMYECAEMNGFKDKTKGKEKDISVETSQSISKEIEIELDCDTSKNAEKRGNESIYDTSIEPDFKRRKLISKI